MKNSVKPSVKPLVPVQSVLALDVPTWEKMCTLFKKKKCMLTHRTGGVYEDNV